MNSSKCLSECKIPKEYHVCKIGYLDTCNCQNSKYIGGITDNSVITCYQIIDTTKSTSAKTFPTKPVPTKSTLTNFYISLAFLLISIYCYLLKCRAKQKNFSSFVTAK